MTAPAPERVDVRHHFGLARKIARAYTRAFGGDFDEAYGIALLAMVKSARVWEPERGAFSTLFFRAAQNALLLALRRRQKSKGIAPQDRTYADRRAKRRTQAFSFVLVPLDQPLGTSELTAADVAADPSPDPERVLMAKEEAADHRRVFDALAVLTERELRIVTARFFEDEPVTLADLGAEFGVTREAIRQHEGRALKKLRRALQPCSAAQHQTSSTEAA